MHETPKPNGNTLKAWLAPGIVIAILMAVISFGSSYAGKLVAEGDRQRQMTDVVNQIAELQKKAEDNRQRFERCELKDDYNRELDRQTQQLNRISDNVDKLKK